MRSQRLIQNVRKLHRYYYQAAENCRGIQFNSIQFKKLSQGSNESMHVSENDDLIPLRFLLDEDLTRRSFNDYKSEAPPTPILVIIIPATFIRRTSELENVRDSEATRKVANTLEILHHTTGVCTTTITTAANPKCQKLH